MQDKQYEKELIELMKYAYGIGKKVRLLDFKTEAVDTELAKKLVEVIGYYNNFDHKKITKTMDIFKNRVSNWQIGKESSPVIYVHLPRWTHHRENAGELPQDRINDIENKKLTDELKDAFVNLCNADEFDTMEYDDRKVRIWWD